MPGFTRRYRARYCAYSASVIMQHPMRKVFINEFGRLRSGWRLLIFIGAFIALSLLLATVGRVVVVVIGLGGPSRAAQFIAELVFRFGLLAAALGAGYF